MNTQYVDINAIDEEIREIERLYADGSETELWQDYYAAKLDGLDADDALWWRNAYQAYEDAEGKIGEDLQAFYDKI